MSTITTSSSFTKSWERLPNETAKAYSAFKVYLQMGGSRSLKNTRQKLAKSSGYRRQLQTWSSKYNWVQRCADYDTELVNQVLINKEEELNKVRAKFIKEAEKATKELFRIASYNHMEGLITEGDEVIPVLMSETDVRILPSKLKAIGMILDRAGVVAIKEEQLPDEAKKKDGDTYIKEMYILLEQAGMKK